MSAYVVDNETINRIVSKVYIDSAYSRAPLYGSLGRIFGSPQTREQIQVLAEDLLAMNHDAVMDRYPDCDATNLPGPIDPEPIIYRHVESSTIQAYKSAQCLRYQCTEGNIEETELYKKLDEACNVLATAIVSSLPEYEKAQWA